MQQLLFMQLTHSSSRTQSLSSHRRTRKLTFNNIRVKHPSISARTTCFTLTNTPPQVLLAQLLYAPSPWSPDPALSNQSKPEPCSSPIGPKAGTQLKLANRWRKCCRSAKNVKCKALPPNHIRRSLKWIVQLIIYFGLFFLSNISQHQAHIPLIL